MKNIKKIFLIINTFFFIFIQTNYSFALTPTSTPIRKANCDLCGYCVNYDPYTQQESSIRQSLSQRWQTEGKNPDSEWEKWKANWQKCQNCLYPALGTSIDPETDKTLEGIPTPIPNRAYTMLGCLAVPGANPDGSFDYVSMALFVNQITTFLLNIAAGIAFLFLIYGAAILALSQSDPERLSEGKRMVYGSLIGLIFALLSNFFLNFIANNILKIPGFS